MRIWLAAAIGALIALAPGPSRGAAAEQTSRLGALPAAGVEDRLPAGATALSNGAFVYRPANAGGGPLPLLILLHGAGGSALGFLEEFRNEADRGGYILLSLQSEGVTWDLIIDAAAKQRAKGEPVFGADVGRIDQVLAELFARAAIDPRRIAIGGFSDGASYALSLGLANPQLFQGIVALSPGFFVAPSAFDRGQRVFITHGRRDRILPFGHARRLAELLESTGMPLRFRPFDGPHIVNPASFDEGVSFAFGQRRRAEPRGPVSR